MKMAKTYNPKEFEDRIYKDWEDNGCFSASVNYDKVPFTIVIPPPNITGQLHMGHALDDTIQDAIIRYKRMRGFETLWLPGTDHASIATEVKIVDQLRKEGIDKHDIGREEFLKRAWAWKDKYGGRIVEQLKHLGCSCDWNRLSFTMDDKCNKAVKEVFVNLYNKGLIYRGSRIINFCPVCGTALSDAEVEYAEENSFLWHIRYDFADGSGSVTVATTRPETMFGDTAVAVNPNDKRYAGLEGKKLILPIVKKEIPLIYDEYVETEFGTGAVKITPAHDPNDFNVGLRHNLEVIRVMNDDGTMNSYAGKFEGLDRFEARKQTVEELEKLGNLVKIEPHAHNVGHCYRCHTSVEPIISKQWFVKMKTLADPAIKAVEDKKVTFIPERFTKIYYNWMENIKDWCISRQLWWGHRIPAYYCHDCGEVIVSKTDVHTCPKCNGKDITQDEDVLDTWFSSALWPFSTLGFPDKTEDLKYFYPTNLLVTGYDIIFFWVARMIFSGIEHMKKVPFKEVLIHGIVRDSQGRKMSKSLGNGIDPLEIIDEYGADPLRFSLVNGISAGNDTRFLKEKLDGCRNFINKIWNASRFVLMNAENVEIIPISECELSLADKWILSKLNMTIRTVTQNMDKYELGNATGELQNFVWDDFCDWYIELCKSSLYSGDEAEKAKTVSVLVYVLGETLKLLHPFIPFVTEEIYSSLPGASGRLITSDYPRYNSKQVFKKVAGDMELVMGIIKSVRNAKNTLGCAPSKKVDLFVVTESKKVINSCKENICKLAGVENIIFVRGKEEIKEKCQADIISGTQIFIPLGELVDFTKEIERIKGEIEKTESEIKRAQGRLNNKGFVEKAPKALIEAEKQKLEKYVEQKEKLLATLKEYEA